MPRPALFQALLISCLLHAGLALFPSPPATIRPPLETPPAAVLRWNRIESFPIGDEDSADTSRIAQSETRRERSVEPEVSQALKRLNSEPPPEPVREPEASPLPPLVEPTPAEAVPRPVEPAPTATEVSRPAESGGDVPEGTAIPSEFVGDASSGSSTVASSSGQEGGSSRRWRGKPATSSLPRPVYTPKPHYPARSRDVGEEGTVVVAILVGEKGAVLRCNIATSSGYPLLDGSALAMVQQKWRFEPGLQEGRPSAQWVRVPVEFKIKSR